MGGDEVIDRDRTLDELDPPAWGPPEEATTLIQRCHALRTVPVGQLTVENLRLLLGQGIAPAILVPLALDVLERDPLAEGDYFPGDLLRNLLRGLPRWSDRRSDWRERVIAVLDRIPDVPDELEDEVATFRGRP